MAVQVAVRMGMGSCSGSWVLAALMAQLALLSVIGPACGGLRRSLQSDVAGSANADAVLYAKLQRANQLYLSNVKRRSQAIAKLGNPRNFSIQDLKAIYFSPVYPCPLELRIGTWVDGGKWVCFEHLGTKVWPSGAGTAVSIGCNGETSFEEAMFRRLHMRPHTLDFSLNQGTQAKVKRKKFMKFYNLGLSGAGTLANYNKLFPSATFVGIQELVQVTGSDNIDVFKIDCETCEYDVVDDMMRVYTRDTVPFGQILMEFHLIFGGGAKRRQGSVDNALKLLRSLEALGYRLFHAEVNMLYPEHYEIALIHEKLTLPPAQSALPPAALAAVLNSSASSDLLRARREGARNSQSKWSTHRFQKLAHYLLVYFVPEYPCAVEARFGNWGVGGKWVCGLHKRMDRAPVLMSISNAAEFSFENDMSRRLHGNVHVLSPPSQRASPVGKGMASMVNFFSGQLSEDMAQAADPLEMSPDFSLSDSVSNVEGAYVDILNIDCHGCEGVVLDEMAATYNKKNVSFGQILVKIQGEPDFAPTLKGLKILKSLGFLMFHAEVFESFNPASYPEVVYWAELAFIHGSIT